MRVLLELLIALAFVAAGVVFGAFNPQPVAIDFHFMQLHAGLGVALLSSLLAGALLGGLAVTIGLVLPLQGQLRKARRDKTSLSPIAANSKPV